MPGAKGVRWSPQADRDLLDIWGYYATVATDAIANRLLHNIYAAADRAAERPRLARPRDELIPGLRSIAIRPYLLFFRMASDDVEIVRVLHERRDLATVFGRDRQP
jgi:toxin ParE1/3/4